MVVGGCMYLARLGMGVKAFIFCGTWAAITRGAHDRTVHPDFARALSIFPPIDPFLKHVILQLKDGGSRKAST